MAERHRSGTRVVAWCSSKATGSGRVAPGAKPAWLDRGTSARRPCPERPAPTRSGGAPPCRARIADPSGDRTRRATLLLQRCPCASPPRDVDSSTVNHRLPDGARSFRLGARRSTVPGQMAVDPPRCRPRPRHVGSRRRVPGSRSCGRGARAVAGQRPVDDGEAAASLAVAVAAAWSRAHSSGPRLVSAALAVVARRRVHRRASGSARSLGVVRQPRLAIAAVALGRYSLARPRLLISAPTLAAGAGRDEARVDHEPEVRRREGRTVQAGRRVAARGIEPVVLQRGDDLVQLAEDAIERGADVIGMAGGDGSQALVASVAAQRGVAHVVVPAGTRNHFALDLGLDRDDVVGALDAFGPAVERRIDLAEVNGRVFVNNVSLGVYGEITQSEEYRDAKVATTLEKLPTLMGPGGEPTDLGWTGPDGVHHDSAHLIRCRTTATACASARLRTRDRLDDGGSASSPSKSRAPLPRWSSPRSSPCAAPTARVPSRPGRHPRSRSPQASRSRRGRRRSPAARVTSLFRILPGRCGAASAAGARLRPRPSQGNQPPRRSATSGESRRSPPVLPPPDCAS